MCRQHRAKLTSLLMGRTLCQSASKVPLASHGRPDGSGHTGAASSSWMGWACHVPW